MMIVANFSQLKSTPTPSTLRCTYVICHHLIAFVWHYKGDILNI